MQVVSSAIVDKYIGESARLIREMFSYARDHQPCIIFMDEIDAIGQKMSAMSTNTIFYSSKKYIFDKLSFYACFVSFFCQNVAFLQ